MASTSPRPATPTTDTFPSYLARASATDAACPAHVPHQGAQNHNRYWLVDRDNANTVVRYRLAGQDYVEAARQPLAWLLNTDPRDHL
jgi:hypothetical protein